MRIGGSPPGTVARRLLAAVAVLTVFVGSLLAPTAAAMGTPVSQEDGGPASPRVLIVTLPRVTWAAVAEHRPPNLIGFLEHAAVASLSTRTVGSRTAPDQAYLTIGAGNRAAAVRGGAAGQVVPVDALLPDGRPAAAEFERRTGIEPTEGSLLALNFVTQQARNDRLLYGARPGALGQTLSDGGLSMAAIGDAATSVDTISARDVALAAADDSGMVAAGEVGESLLVADDTASFGLSMSPDAYEDALRSAWRTADVAIVELGETERVERARAFTRPERSAEAFAAAMELSDEVFGRLLATVDTDRDLVILTSPTAPLAAEELTLFAMAGPGVPAGWAFSSTTRRAGYVSLTDIAPTIVRTFGLDVPESMYDTPIAGRAASDPLDARMDTMVRANERALFADRATSPITVAFIVLLVVMLVTVVAVVARRQAIPNWVRVLVLGVFATPATMYAAGLLPYGPFNNATYGATVIVAAMLLGFVASRLETVDPVLPSFLLGSMSLAVMLMDVVTGASLQLNTVFGYSPIVAGRFAGFGNQAFALVGISTLVVATTGWQMWEARRPGSPRWWRLGALLALFLTVIVLVGLPQFGSDVGGVLASVPAFAVCALLLSGRRINLRTGFAIAVASVGVLALFAVVDMARPPESRTHLSRFVAKLFAGEAPVILERKLSTNISILTSTIWTLTIPLALAFFAYLAWRPDSITRSLENRHPAFRAFEISFLTLGVVAFALNDSGIALPAMMLAIVLPHTAFLVLGVLNGELDPVEPERSVEPAAATRSARGPGGLLVGSGTNHDTGTTES